MRQVIAILVGAVAFHLATAGAEARSTEIGDVIRLVLFACALCLLAGSLRRERARRPDAAPYVCDDQSTRVGRRVVTLTLCGTDKPEPTRVLPRA